jgi:hypothetical protein
VTGHLSYADLVYQRGYLYYLGLSGGSNAILQTSAEDGTLTNVLPLPGVSPTAIRIAAWPNDDRLLATIVDQAGMGTIVQIDTITGEVSPLEYSGAEIAWGHAACAMRSPTELLVASYPSNPDWPGSYGTVSVDLTTGVAALVYQAPRDWVLPHWLDPEDLDTIQSRPPFARDNEHRLYVVGSNGWSLVVAEDGAAAPLPWIGWQEPVDPPTGFGPDVILADTRDLAVLGDIVYVAAWYRLADGLRAYTLALGSKLVGSFAPDGAPARARAFASDGVDTIFFVASKSCGVYRVVRGDQTISLVWPGRSTCSNDTGVFEVSHPTAIQMTFLHGHLYLVGNDAPGVLDLDPASGESHVIPSTTSIWPRDIAAGSDGMLYVSCWEQSLGWKVLRLDPATCDLVSFASGGPALAADRAGHLFVEVGSTVERLDLATGEATTVAGVPDGKDVVPGPLPGGLGASIQAIATTAAGDLVIATSSQGHPSALLLARLSTTSTTQRP